MTDTIPPKHPSQRRRRNKPPVKPRVLSSKARVKKIPALPGTGWTPAGRAYWKRIWSSPMATQYLDADVPGLQRLTRLAQRAATGELGVAALGEMRHLEDRFGLSPLSRRRLQIDIDTDLLAKSGAEEPQDDERWLRVVGDE
jgi:hypothetical protein